MKLKSRIGALSLVLVLMLVSTSLVAAQGTLVEVKPTWQEVYVGERPTVEVWASDVTDFFGVQFTLTFPEAILEGVSVEPGSAFTAFPDEYQIVQDEVAPGVVRFAATLLRVPKAGPLSGNVQLAVITFHALDEGEAMLVFDQVKLSDVTGSLIPFTPVDGLIDVLPRSTLTGSAYLEGRGNHSGVLVTLFASPLMVTVTDSAGAYTFEDVPPGTYEVTMSADLYLEAAAAEVTVNRGVTNYACGATLLGGDLDGNGVINILDLTPCAAAFGSSAPEADINADGIVDIYDLVLLGKNFGLVAPTDVSCSP